MLRTIWGDKQRYKKQYWSEVKGCYFTGDGARRDKDGYFWIVGRIDDVLNVAGHRLGTSEIESALVSHPGVAEAAVVGRPDEMKGQAIVAFVTLKENEHANPELREKLREHVSAAIGAIAKPDDVRFADALPKTRSGKIMRRLLKEIAGGGQVTGDTTTLEDFNVLAKLKGIEE
jgi:acetyl-CoA synthetase